MTGDPRRGRPGRPADGSVSSDPYATLGLPTNAPMADVKRAYRRLAKAFHPDSAGAAALPRFLAIHEAYERIRTGRVLQGRVPSTATSSPASPPSREPWRADPARARATRGRPAGSTGNTGDSTRARAGSEPGTSGQASKTRGSRRAQARKATLGSTSYDDARDRADAAWSGASWYGPTTGEYWIINPREYADPRKHGPAYQARVRQQAAEVAEATPAEAGDAADASGNWAQSTQAGPEPVDSRDGSPAHARASRAETGAAAPQPVGGDRPTVSRPDRPAAGEAGRDAWPARPATADVPPWTRWPLLGGPADDPIRRLRLALVAWPPLGVAAALAAGEVTGCAVYAASCTGMAPLLPWLGQAVILALLLLLPPLARLLAVGTVAVLLALVPVTAVLIVLGAGGQPQAGFALGVLLALAWLAGVTFGAVSAARRASLSSIR